MNKPDVRLANTVRKLLREKALLDHAEKDTKTHAVLLLLSFALDAEELHDKRVRDIVSRAARVTSDDSNADDFNAKLAADAQALIRDYPGSYPTAKDPSATEERSKNEGKPTETTRSDMAEILEDAVLRERALDARLQQLRETGIDPREEQRAHAQAVIREGLKLIDTATVWGPGGERERFLAFWKEALKASEPIAKGLGAAPDQAALDRFIADDPGGSKQPVPSAFWDEAFKKVTKPRS